VGVAQQPCEPDAPAAGSTLKESAHEAPSPDRERGRAAAGGEVGIVNASTYVDRVWLEAARAARRAPTPAEALAWDLLRNRRCLGLKFRREQIIEGFRADLYCASLRLSIEIDGSVHDDPEQRACDELRTQALNALSIRVLRIRNEDVSMEAFERMLGPLLRGREGG
jgi:very-short-patch-repair endonuclease